MMMNTAAAQTQCIVLAMEQLHFQSLHGVGQAIQQSTQVDAGGKMGGACQQEAARRARAIPHK